MKVRPVILCGGSGTRLWPKKKNHQPKQFIQYFFYFKDSLRYKLKQQRSMSSRMIQKRCTQKKKKTVCTEIIKQKV